MSITIIKRFIFIISTCCILISCGVVKTVTVPTYFKFEKETTFTISDYSKVIDDNITSDLNYKLKDVGFNTISFSNAKKAIEYKEKPSMKLKNDEIIEILSIKNMISIYDIQIVYKKNTSGFSNDFAAFVVYMNTQKTVLYYHNSTDKSFKLILNSFSKKLFEKIIKN